VGSLVGRGAEQAELEAALASARDGEAAALVVLGEAGIGKTSLLAFAAAQADGFRQLSTSGIESESVLEFAGLHDVCTPLLPLASALPDRQARALHVALGFEDASLEPFVLAAATLALLAAAAEQTPLLVCVDDAHWLDASSLGALAFAARRLDRDRVAVLFAARGETPPPELEGQQLLRLGRLDAGSAASVLDEAAGPLDEGARDRLLALAEGNPMALRMLPAVLRDEERQGRLPLAEPLRVGTPAERALAARTSALDVRARRALVVAAASSRIQGALLPAALAELELGLRDLEPASESGLVEPAAGGYRFVHPLARSAAYHAALPADRRRAHLALASVHASLGETERAAWHRAAAADGPDAAVAEALADVATRARARGGYSEAAAGFERAAQLTPPGPERLARLTAAADAVWLTGRGAEAIGLIEEALSEGPERPARAELLALRGKIESSLGSSHMALAFLREAAALHAPERPEEEASLLALASCFVTDDTKVALELAERAYGLTKRDGSLADFQATLALGDSYGSRGARAEARPLLARALDLLDEDGLLRGHPRNLIWAANACSQAGDRQRGRLLSTRAVETIRAEGPLAMLPNALAWRTTFDINLGQFDQVVADAQEALEWGFALGDHRSAAAALTSLTQVEAIRGEAESCRAHVDQALELHRRYGSTYVLIAAERSLALLDLGEDRYEPVCGRAEALAARSDRLPVDEPWVSLTPLLVEAYAARGLVGEAEAAAERYRRGDEDDEESWVLAIAARCAALTAPGDRWEAEFERALELHARPDAHDPFQEARTRLLFGERLRRAGRVQASREHLRAALETFEQLRARPWARRARTELAATGETRRRRGLPLATELTPQELQVSLLAGEGRTNREIAEALFLSPKTVQYHLTNAFRKLGIKRRAELGRRFASASRD